MVFDQHVIFITQLFADRLSKRLIGRSRDGYKQCEAAKGPAPQGIRPSVDYS
jgi:hypothetical protein